MKIRTVAILGAGAIGGYFIWGLSEKLGDNLWVIADGERKERLERDGIRINGQPYKLHVRTPREAHGADLLLVATKYGALRQVLDDIAQVADEHTTVMSLLNGVDSEEIIAERIGKERILYSLMRIASERRADGVFFDPEVSLGVYYGEIDSPKKSPRMLALEELLADTGIHYHPCENMMQEIWYKYSLNVSQNLPQAILGCGIGAYKDSEYVHLISKRLREEVVAVAAAKGIDISSPAKTEGSAKPTYTRRARYSTLQDLDNKRHTEVDMFAGAMVRMGKELGIPTPYNEYTYCAIKALEEKNDGKFDYE